MSQNSYSPDDEQASQDTGYINPLLLQDNFGQADQTLPSTEYDNPLLFQNFELDSSQAANLPDDINSLDPNLLDLYTSYPQMPSNSMTTNPAVTGTVAAVSQPPSLSFTEKILASKGQPLPSLPEQIAQQLPLEMHKRRQETIDQRAEYDDMAYWRFSYTYNDEGIFCNYAGLAMPDDHPIRMQLNLPPLRPEQYLGKNYTWCNAKEGCVWWVESAYVDYFGCLVDQDHPMWPSSFENPWVEIQLQSALDQPSTITEPTQQEDALGDTFDNFFNLDNPIQFTQLNATNQTLSVPSEHAQRSFTNSFPSGWEIIPNDGHLDLLCGVYAIRDSWIALRESQGEENSRLPAWEDNFMESLRYVLHFGEWAKSYQAYNSEPDQDLTKNYFNEQLAHGLKQWASEKFKLKIRLGRFQSNNNSTVEKYFILDMDNQPAGDSVITLWIHHNGWGGNTGDHWEGLRAKTALSTRRQSTRNRSVDTVSPTPASSRSTRSQATPAAAARDRTTSSQGPATSNKYKDAPEAKHRCKKTTANKRPDSMSKEEREVYLLRQEKLTSAPFPARYNDLGRLKRDCKINESLYYRNEEFCTFPEKRGKREADDTFPKSDAEMIKYAKQLYNAVLDCSDFMDWASTIESGNRNRRQDLKKIKAYLEAQQQQERQRQESPENRYIPNAAREWIPSQELCFKRIVGLESCLNNYSIAQMCIELAEACVPAQQGHRKAMTHHHFSNWEAYASYAKRIEAVAFVLRVLKQTVKNLTVLGNTETMKIANCPVGELDKKIANKTLNNAKGDKLKDASNRTGNLLRDTEGLRQAMTRQRERKRKRTEAGKDPDADTSDEEADAEAEPATKKPRRKARAAATTTTAAAAASGNGEENDEENQDAEEATSDEGEEAEENEDGNIEAQFDAQINAEVNELFGDQQLPPSMPQAEPAPRRRAARAQSTRATKTTAAATTAAATADKPRATRKRRANNDNTEEEPASRAAKRTKAPAAASTSGTASRTTRAGTRTRTTRTTRK